MTGRSIFRAVAVVALLIVLAGAGFALYNVGVNVGMNVAVQQAVQNGQPVPVAPYGYGPYWHGGFGFFGIFFGIIGILLIVGLVRAAFGWGRGGGRGMGMWGHWPGGPGRFGSRDEAIAAWHRELHRREEPADSTAPDSPRPTPPGT